MAEASTVLDLVDAMRQIYDDDSIVQGITGRATLNFVPRGAQKLDPNLPLTTWQLIASPRIRGTGVRRRVVVQVESWISEEETDLTKLYTLMDRAIDLFTGVNFAAVPFSLDAGVDPNDSIRSGLLDAREGVRSLGNDFTIDLKVA